MTNKDDQVLVDALKEFENSNKEAEKKLEQDFKEIFEFARKDAEERSRKKEEEEMADIDKELAAL